MRIVTAYTPDYEPMAQRLIASCEQFNVPITPVPFESRGDWISNNNSKPLHILRVMRESGDDVCWLDADMYLHAPMPEFAKPADCWLVRSVQPIVFDFAQGKIVPNTERLPVPWGGHCAFACKPVGMRLLDLWAGYCARHTPATNDEQCLRAAISEQCLRDAIGEYKLISVAPFPAPSAWLTHLPAGHTHGKPPAWSNL